MANYKFKLTPALRGEGTEGGLDTSVTGTGDSAVSAQRGAYIDVWVDQGEDGVREARKTVAGIDGKTFDDTIAVWSDNTDIESV